MSTIDQLITSCETARAGDSIILSPGVYKISKRSRIRISDRTGPIVVRGATGNPSDIIIEGSGQDDPAVQVIFDLDNSPRWTFQDFTTRNTYYHGFKFNGGSSNCVLRHIVMRDHGESGVKGTSNPSKGIYSDRLVIEQCDIGFTSDLGGTRQVVEGVDGVGVIGWQIRSNRFVNILHGKNAAYGVFTKGNSADTIIEANRFEHCSIGASFGGGGTGARFFRDNNRQFEHRGGIVRNNVFVRCTDAAVYMNKAHHFKVFNNTLFDCFLGIQLRYPESSGWVCNNLVSVSPANPGEPLVRARDRAKLIRDEANRPAIPSDFVNAAAADAQIDLHLRPGSAAIDSGVDLAADVPLDSDGRNRPNGNGCDVGAYEFQK